MIISGLQKLTLLDYPGTVACTVFTRGCNLRCPFCHNASLVVGEAPEEIPLPELMSFLTKRRGVLEGVAITGGEPTLNADLPELIGRIRALGYKIKLDTNGTNPDMLRELTVSGLVDRVAMDIKNDPAHYPDAVGCTVDIGRVDRSRELLMSGAVDYEFRTTVVKGKYFITVENLSVIYEDVALPSAGTYRYTFYVHSRLNDKTGTYRHNPLRFWVEKKGSGVTNVIGQVDCYNSDWVQRFFDFTVDDAGTYRLALQGCDNPTAASKHFHEAHVDAISVKQIVRGKRGEEATFDPDLKIRVAEGAKLRLDYPGTNRIAVLSLGGRGRGGVVTAETDPDYVSGPGALEIVPDVGAIILVR